MMACVAVTVTVNGAAVPPALLANEPVHVPAVGDDEAIAIVNDTEPPTVLGIWPVGGVIVATVPWTLLAPTVHDSVGVNTGRTLACDTLMTSLVVDPPITSCTEFAESAMAPDAGVGVGVRVGVGVGLADGVDVGIGVALGRAVGCGISVGDPELQCVNATATAQPTKICRSKDAPVRNSTDESSVRGVVSIRALRS